MYLHSEVQHKTSIPIWKTAPFTRLLIPLITGIIVQWYGTVSLWVIISAFGCFSFAVFLFRFLPATIKYQLHALQAILLLLLVALAGMLITWCSNAKHYNSWYGNFYQPGDVLIVTINEPPTEKSKSYKATASITKIIRHDSVLPVNGKLVLYFAKDSAINIQYGDEILINEPLQPIKNSGNPGAFNYERYAAFQQLFHTVYLLPGKWKSTGNKQVNFFYSFLFRTKKKVLSLLKQNISGTNELSIAEALLIGYTNDLDKDLVQAYSNTGVVHIIAISGMHLGLIYGLLVLLCHRLPLLKKSRWLQTIIILSSLWIFSLLTGGSASVIRSAVMFSFITAGTMFFKKTSVYNSLAASAFVMLCYNPYYLWDVGFQLSYLAVTGIILFQQPIYNLWYVKNKLLDNIWKACAITTAAQLLTFPACIYYFHQFPLLFLFANLLAVPLSTIILYGIIMLLCTCWLPLAAAWAGKIISWLLWLMNFIILQINQLPFAVWDSISSSALSTLLLYIIIIAMATWLTGKHRNGLIAALSCIAALFVTHAINLWQQAHQQKLIVYHVPQHRAIDFTHADSYQFVGDSVLLEDAVLQNFHLKPGRIDMLLSKRTDSLPGIFHDDIFYMYGDKKIVLINQPVSAIAKEPLDVDIIVISNNPKLYIAQLAGIFRWKQLVFDASNPLWKIEKWKQDCDELNLHYHSVPHQGAFITDL